MKNRFLGAVATLFALGPMAANATLIDVTIDITVNGIVFDDVLVAEGIFFNDVAGDQNIQIDYSESGGSSIFGIFLRDTQGPSLSIGGYDIEFVNLIWAGVAGQITSLVADTTGPIAQALIDFDPTSCGGNPFCEANVLFTQNEVIDTANILAGGSTSFTANSIDYSAPIVITNRGGRIDLVFESAHTAISVPEPGTLTLFGLGLVGLGIARRKVA